MHDGISFTPNPGEAYARARRSRQVPGPQPLLLARTGTLRRRRPRLTRTELNDGVVPVELEDKARARGGQLSRVRDLDHGGNACRTARPSRDWSTDFDHTDPQLGRTTPTRSGTSCASECPVAHSDRYGGTWLPVTHEAVAEVAYDTEHFTSRSVDRERDPTGRRRPARADRHRAADHLRSAVPRARPPAAASRVRPRSRSTRTSRTRATCATSCSTRSATAASSTPPSTTRRTFRCASSPRMLGFPESGRRQFRYFIRIGLEDVDAPAEERQAQIEAGELDEYLDARIARSSRAPPRRPHLVLARGRDSTATSSSPTTCAARWCC